MKRHFKITHPRARLEAELVVAPSFSPGFALVRYELGQVNARWWQRTIEATDNQWLRLSGRDGTNPANTWSKILNEDKRPVLPLPMLVLADFVAYATNPMQPEAWWLFNWAAWALDHLLRLNPLPPSTKGGMTVVPTALETMTHALIEAMLDGDAVLPWPTTDGAQLQTLIRLGELVWSFPPDLVRRLVAAFVALSEQETEDTDDLRNGQANSLLVCPGQLVQLSALHCWRTGVPRVRQLSIHMSTTGFPALLQQALIVTHPDAPSIEDVDLARLCDGTIGHASDPPSPIQSHYNDVIDLSDFSPDASRIRIAAYTQEVATRTTSLPIGQWDVASTAHFPLFRAFDLRAVRVFTLPDGCWVRLLPHRDRWGKVLWWIPQVEPPACLAFGLGTGREDVLVWAVHETMWMLWRDIQVSGIPHPG